MKKHQLLFLLIFLTFSAGAQKQSIINGTVPSAFNGDYVYLEKMDTSNVMATPILVDSLRINDGRFSFKIAPSNDVILYSVKHKNTSGMFALDGEQLTVTYVNGNPLAYFQIRGSKLNDDFSKILEFGYNISESELILAKKRKEALSKNEWTLEDEEAAKEKNKIVVLDFQKDLSQFVKNNISNAAGLYIYIIYAIAVEKDTKQEIEANLSENNKHKINEARQYLTNMMTSMKNSSSTEGQLKPGDKFIDFEGELLSGEKTKLSEAIVSKKLILLDFWASWCIPCLKEMPEIVELHNKHKDKGLQIVGISLDKNRDKWKDAVESLGMQWIQFIDSNLSNPISTIYQASTIPHTVLIDGKGSIVAVGLRGEKLKNKIEEFLSQE